MNKILFLVMIGLLMSPELAEAALVLSATGEVTPSQLVPGNDGYIKLTINNIGSSDLPIIYVQLVSLDSPLVLEKATDFDISYIGGINAGGSAQKIYKFRVPPGTPSGTYAAKYAVSQSVAEGTKLLVSGIVLIPVQAPSSLIVKSLSPTSFRAGERTGINITISNSGGARLSDLTLSWQTSSDIILPLGSDNKFVLQSIEPRQEIVLPLSVVVSPDVKPGVYSFLAKMAYHDQTGTEKTANSTIGIIIERVGEADLSVRFSPSSFRPGEKAELTFDVMNVGESDLSDISISWSAEDDVVLPLGQSNKFSLKALKVGEQAQIPIAVIVDSEALPGIYSLSFKTTYLDKKGIQKTDNFTLGVLVGGGTDFRVGVQEVSGGTTSLSIGNIGVNPAKAVSLGIPAQEGFSVTEPSDVFVGNLDPGDFTVASFQLVQRRGNTLKVKIAYTDASGNREELEKEIVMSINATSRGAISQGQFRAGIAAHSGANSGYRNIMIGAGGLLGLGVAYLVWRRKRQK